MRSEALLNSFCSAAELITYTMYYHKYVDHQPMDNILVLK